jgi:phage shock protein E
MKTLVTLLLLLLVAASSASAATSAEPTTIQGRIVIDVRSQAEWDGGHIDGAVHIPYDQIASRITEVTTDKNARIGLYCQSGGRAGMAMTTLKDKGYINVENLGGIITARKTLGLAP